MGDARDDWKIVRALSEVLGAPLPYNSLDDVRRRLTDVAPHLARRDAVEVPLWLAGEQWKAAGDKKTAADSAPLASGIANFYQTDAISRASKVGRRRGVASWAGWVRWRGRPLVAGRVAAAGTPLALWTAWPPPTAATAGHGQVRARAAEPHSRPARCLGGQLSQPPSWRCKRGTNSRLLKRPRLGAGPAPAIHTGPVASLAGPLLTPSCCCCCSPSLLTHALDTAGHPRPLPLPSVA